jgi:phosphoglycerate dehydrogenase-like enzyme
MTVGILLSDEAHRRYWQSIVEAVPDAAAVVVAPGSDRIDTDGVEVAWATPEVHEPAMVRRFYGAALHAPGLRWFQSASAGVDEGVFGRFLERGVRLTSAHVNAIPIAEFVMRAVLDHVHGAARWRDDERRHVWDMRPYDEVHGQTWAIVGFGAIGQEVARRARAFGVHIRGVRQRPAPSELADVVVGTNDLRVALGGAHVVVIALPLTDATAGVIDDDVLAAMAPGSLLVNVGRGGLLDEDALVRALDRGAPSAAALDVVATEPLPTDHPFWADPRIVITPHNAGSSTGNADRLCDLFIRNLRAYVAGEPLAHEESPGGASTGR